VHLISAQASLRLAGKKAHGVKGAIDWCHEHKKIAAAGKGVIVTNMKQLRAANETMEFIHGNRHLRCCLTTRLKVNHLLQRCKQVHKTAPVSPAPVPPYGTKSPEIAGEEGQGLLHNHNLDSNHVNHMSMFACSHGRTPGRNDFASVPKPRNYNTGSSVAH
jgi:hypothetical protein